MARRLSNLEWFVNNSCTSPTHLSFHAPRRLLDRDGWLFFFQEFFGFYPLRMAGALKA